MSFARTGSNEVRYFPRRQPHPSFGRKVQHVLVQNIDCGGSDCNTTLQRQVPVAMVTESIHACDYKDTDRICKSKANRMRILVWST